MDELLFDKEEEKMGCSTLVFIIWGDTCMAVADTSTLFQAAFSLHVLERCIDSPVGTTWTTMLVCKGRLLLLHTNGILTELPHWLTDAAWLWLAGRIIAEDDNGTRSSAKSDACRLEEWVQGLRWHMRVWEVDRPSHSHC